MLKLRTEPGELHSLHSFPPPCVICVVRRRIGEEKYRTCTSPLHITSALPPVIATGYSAIFHSLRPPCYSALSPWPMLPRVFAQTRRWVSRKGRCSRASCATTSSATSKNASWGVFSNPPPRLYRTAPLAYVRPREQPDSSSVAVMVIVVREGIPRAAMVAEPPGRCQAQEVGTVETIMTFLRRAAAAAAVATTAAAAAGEASVLS